MGPDLKPLKAEVEYLRRILEAIAEHLGIDTSKLGPPPPLS